MQDIERIKEYILYNNKIPTILENLDCKYIKENSKYFQCANPDGDNQTAIIVYKNPNLFTIDYTRNIDRNKAKTKTDIFNLIEFFKDVSFIQSVKWCCDIIGLNYYHKFDEELPESLKITRMLRNMQNEIFESSEIDDTPVQKIPEVILNYYNDLPNLLFYQDNISCIVQKEFEIGYDGFSNRITIPIRDEIGNLVGIKGRLFKKELDEYDKKYLYLEPTNKSKILFGLFKSFKHINENSRCFVFESEKAVMQAYTFGCYNCVAIGGKQISQNQINMLSRLYADVVICFDKDVGDNELESIGNRFLEGVNVYVMVDRNNILNEKESPTDNYEKWKILIKNSIYKIK